MMAKKRSTDHAIYYQRYLDRLAQLAGKKPPRPKSYPRPLTDLDRILIQLYSHWQLAMTPKEFISKWEVSREDMALICSRSISTVNSWFAGNKRYKAPAADVLRGVTISI
ncbi:hypothetical protein [Moorena sp. SIO3I6]|uniref:hypothetical protein n=1 Tax=Moorena sp. SIO3I6 TaxID=2607831 RepID=UPI0025F74DE1|nr:hypothetical protein [Moorena sp. SIO3I6]